MAKPVITYKASNYVTTAGPTFTAAPQWTPAANSLLVALVCGCSASPSDPTGVTGHGQTYTKVVLPTATLSTTHIMSVWVANAGASPSNVAEVASFGGTPTGDVLICFEITGWASAEQVINAFGTNIDTGTAGSGTTGTVTLQLRPDVTSEHVELSFWIHLANEATTFRTNWTETAGADGNFNSPATGAEAQFRTDAFELTCTATWTTSSAWRGLGLVVRGTATTPQETPKVADTVTVTRTPLDVPLLTESVKVLGGGRADLRGRVHSGDTLTPPTLVAGGDPDLTPPLLTENVKAADTVTVVLDPLESRPTEACKVSDLVTVVENPLETALQDVIKCADVVTAAITEEVNKQETVKVSDTLTVSENPLETSRTETVKVSDTATPTLDPIERSVQEIVKVSDSTPPLVEIALPPVLLTENVKVADTVAVLLNPEEATLQEIVKVSEELFASSGAIVAPIPAENIKVGDQASVTLDPLETTRTENIKCADTLTASRWLEAQPAESVKCADTLTASLTVLPASADESVRCADSVNASLSVLFVTATESCKVADSTPPLVFKFEVTANVTETETVKVSDAVTAVFPVLVAALTETLHCRDQVSGLLVNLHPEFVLARNVRLSSAVATARLEVATPQDISLTTSEMDVELEPV